MKTPNLGSQHGGSAPAPNGSGASGDPASTSRMDRRTAIKWMLTAAASTALLDHATLGAETVKMPAAVPGGYGTDPDLLKTYKAGDVWPLTFNEQQRTAATALCDAIIPQDEKGPSASSLKVQDFIDEWVSAPYETHDRDKRTIVDGLVWLDAESQKRFGNNFANLIARQKNAICDDICSEAKAKPELRQAARFFKRFRDLTAGGYYTTPEGMKDIGYVGNVALARYDGPPREVLQKLGVV
jgi:hypothetical protein